MPSKSQRMHNTMAKAKNDPAFAKKMDIPQKVAEEYLAADKRSGKFRKGKKKR